MNALAELAATGRIAVRYRVATADVGAVAEAVRIEQTIEYPLELITDGFIRDEVVGQVEDVTQRASGSEFTLSFHPDVAGGELSQLLNLLWGNVSLFECVRVVDVALPDAVLDVFFGPRFGLAGLRVLLDAPHRPLLTTAIKPMGLPAADLGEMAATLAIAGFDIVKDDHGLANQPWAPFRERVRTVSAAVAEANAASGNHCLYMPSLNVPSDRQVEAAYFAKESGAGALLVLPGLAGLDAMRSLADDPALGLPIMAHPSFQGSLVVNADQGLRHGLLFGLLARLAGADLSIFPSHGGRFSFSPEACADIADSCRRPLGGIAPIWPAPGGGMTLERVDEIANFYGLDVALLIGGALHRGNLAANATALAEKVRELGSAPTATMP